MRISPNDPLWPIYLWWLINHGDPGPDDDGGGPFGPRHIFQKVLTASTLMQVAATVKEPQAKTILQEQAFHQLKSAIPQEEFEGESYR